MFSKPLAYANQRELAKKSVAESFEYQKFKNSEYFLPKRDKVLEAIGLLLAIPEKARTAEDNALLFDFYQYAGYIKIKPEYLSDFQFESGLPYREKAVALQRKIFATKKTDSEETTLAKMLWHLSIAYFKQCKNDCDKAMTTLTEAITMLAARKTLTSEDLESLIQFHETASQIALSSNSTLETHAHYQAMIRYTEQLNKTLENNRERKELNQDYIAQVKIQMQNLWRKRPEAVMNIADQLLAAQLENKLLQAKIHDLEKKHKKDNIGNFSSSLSQVFNNGSNHKSRLEQTQLVNNWFIPKGGLR